VCVIVWLAACPRLCLRVASGCLCVFACVFALSVHVHLCAPTCLGLLVTGTYGSCVSECLRVFVSESV